MKKMLCILPLLSCTAYAVQTHTLWGNLPPSFSKHAMSNQTQLLKSKNGHHRYQVMYQGIPVWGYHVVQHEKSQRAYTGHLISGIEKDVPSLDAKWSPEKTKKAHIPDAAKHEKVEKIIYIHDDKAQLAYHVSYFLASGKALSRPVKIIDANKGTILKTYNALHTKRIGAGPGGNYAPHPHRDSFFDYAPADMYSNIGHFEVALKGTQCTTASAQFEIVNMKNKAFDWDQFPVMAHDHANYKPFSYRCNKKNGYINNDDGGYAPINNGRSPINDAMFFAQTTYDMYQLVYGDDMPFGDDLPIRAYTHVGDFDNAFALGTEYEQGKIVFHQQIVLGNGERYFAPLTQTTIPHELSHNVTDVYSGLIYDGHSGGINEAFSDMADLALRSYIRRMSPWYWNGTDWTIGREETLDGSALRYMETPSDDGYSINTADDYTEYTDVHHSSGVFNRAFFLLAHAEGWNEQMAFQVMFDANRYYWVPNTNFDFAACGVIQATEDKHWNASPVITAFKAVGVTCPLVE